MSMAIKAYEVALLGAMRKGAADGQYQGTYDDLVALTGWQLKTVMKNVKALIASQQLEVVRLGRSGHPSIYRIKEEQIG